MKKKILSIFSATLIVAGLSLTPFLISDSKSVNKNNDKKFIYDSIQPLPSYVTNFSLTENLSTTSNIYDYNLSFMITSEYSNTNPHPDDVNPYVWLDLDSSGTLNVPDPIELSGVQLDVQYNYVVDYLTYSPVAGQTVTPILIIDDSTIGYSLPSITFEEEISTITSVYVNNITQTTATGNYTSSINQTIYWTNVEGTNYTTGVWTAKESTAGINETVELISLLPNTQYTFAVSEHADYSNPNFITYTTLENQSEQIISNVSVTDITQTTATGNFTTTTTAPVYWTNVTGTNLGTANWESVTPIVGANTISLDVLNPNTEYTFAVSTSSTGTNAIIFTYSTLSDQHSISNVIVSNVTTNSAFGKFDTSTSDIVYWTNVEGTDLTGTTWTSFTPEIGTNQISLNNLTSDSEYTFAVSNNSNGSEANIFTYNTFPTEANITISTEVDSVDPTLTNVNIDFISAETTTLYVKITKVNSSKLAPINIIVPIDAMEGFNNYLFQLETDFEYIFEMSFDSSMSDIYYQTNISTFAPIVTNPDSSNAGLMILLILLLVIVILLIWYIWWYFRNKKFDGEGFNPFSSINPVNWLGSKKEKLPSTGINNSAKTSPKPNPYATKPTSKPNSSSTSKPNPYASKPASKPNSSSTPKPNASTYKSPFASSTSKPNPYATKPPYNSTNSQQTSSAKKDENKTTSSNSGNKNKK